MESNPTETPSLIGSSVRCIVEEEKHPDSASRSPTRATFKDNVDSDYTPLNQLVHEGALIGDEVEYDQLLDPTGRFKPDVPCETPIPGAESKDYFSKPVAQGVKKQVLEEVTVNQTVEKVSEDKEGPDNEVVVVDIFKRDVDLPPTDRVDSGTIYDIKSQEDNDVSLEDLIDSQIASISELSTGLKTKRKKKLKKKPSSKAEDVIPGHVIENDSPQTVPAGVPEGVFSPLVQSRSQSTARSTSKVSNEEKPHLARGDSYTGSNEFRPGRRVNREESVRITGSSDYLRSVSRSRTRLASTDRAMTVNELATEGALLYHSGMNSDLQEAHDEFIDHVELKVVEEAEEPESETHRLPFSVPISSDEVKGDLTTVKKLSEYIKSSNEKPQTANDVSISGNIKNDITSDDITENPQCSAASINEIETKLKDEDKTEQEYPRPNSDIKDEVSDPLNDDDLDAPSEIAEVIEEKLDSEIRTIEKGSSPEDGDISESDKSVASPKPQEDNGQESTSAEIQVDGEGSEKQRISSDVVVEDLTAVGDCTYQQALEELADREKVIVEDDTTSEQLKDVEAHKVQDSQDEDIADTIELESTTKKGSDLTIHDATERLIMELEHEISESSSPSLNKVVKEKSSENTGDEENSEGVADEVALITPIAKSGVVETEPHSEDTAKESPKAQKEDDLEEELHEPTKEEIIELLKDEPVYIYTSLAGGGFHMPTRTNKLATILTANRIPFTYRDCGTDDEARAVWRRYSKGRLLPGVVRGKDDIIGNWEEIEEANEDYRVKELIYETL